jgi:uncharacterized OsmC-like protein
MAISIEVDYAHRVQFAVRARQHALVSDQPPDNGGSDEGMTPPELLLASLGTCAGYYAAEYLRTRHLDTAGLRVRVTAEKALKPTRLTNFHVDVEAPSCDDERHREGVLRAAKNCLIHNTLLHAPEIDISINKDRTGAPQVAMAESK